MAFQDPGFICLNLISWHWDLCGWVGHTYTCYCPSSLTCSMPRSCDRGHMLLASHPCMDCALELIRSWHQACAMSVIHSYHTSCLGGCRQDVSPPHGQVWRMSGMVGLHRSICTTLQTVSRPCHGWLQILEGGIWGQRGMGDLSALLCGWICEISSVAYSHLFFFLFYMARQETIAKTSILAGATCSNNFNVSLAHVLGTITDIH